MSGAEPLGSAAEEAARLLDAVRRWVDDRAIEPDPGEHDAQCRYCPLCHGAAALKQSQPEVYEHLSRAVDSLFAAVRASATSHTHQPRPEPPDVQHIVVT
jgi:hypothetical protein